MNQQWFMHIHHKMKGENKFEKEKIIAINFSNNDGTVHPVQFYDSNGRAVG